MRTKKLNLDMDSYLNSNELLNFGKSIEESSRLALKKIKAGKNESTVLEESIQVQKFEEAKTAKFDPDFIFNTANKAKKLQKIEEAKTFISTDKYNEEKLKEKFKIDLPYLKSLEEGFKFEETKETYNRILEEALVITADLYKETNTTPRLTSLALDSTLTESEAFAIYENKFKNSLEENFRLKLLNGTLLEENMEPVKKIIKISVDKGLGEDVGEIDPAKMGTVLGFNNVLGDHLKDVMLPEGARQKIESFLDTQAPDYKNIPGNADELLHKLHEKIDALTTLLSGIEFDKNVEMDEDIDAGKYSAVAKVCSMSGDENVPGCAKSEAAEAEEDLDNDGTPDEDENHGELPEDFKGDHSDALKDDESEAAEAEEETPEQSVEDDIEDAAAVIPSDEEAKEEIEADGEANVDDQVMDSLELHDGEDAAKEDIEQADKEVGEIGEGDEEVENPDEAEDAEENGKELIETKAK
jgi:hypothetical protein